jgi:hypothetical protein
MDRWALEGSGRPRARLRSQGRSAHRTTSAAAGQSPGSGTILPRDAVARSEARCQGLAFEIRDVLVQKLAADALSLEAADRGNVADPQRKALEARAGMVGRCARLLVGVAELLEGLAAEALAAPSGRREVDA